MWEIYLTLAIKRLLLVSSTHAPLPRLPPPTPPPPAPCNRKDNPPLPPFSSLQCSALFLVPEQGTPGHLCLKVYFYAIVKSLCLWKCTSMFLAAQQATPRSPAFESALLCYSKETLASHPSVTCGFRRVCRGARPLTRALPLYSSLIPVAIILFSGEALTQEGFYIIPVLEDQISWS